jgi:hypothetical protein
MQKILSAITRQMLLFSVPGNYTLVVFDYKAGKVMTTLPISKAVGTVVFNTATQLLYSSNRDDTVTIIRQDCKDT